MTFLSTPSGWRATGSHVFLSTLLSYFYPRPPGGGRLVLLRQYLFTGSISIHALRVEGDIALGYGRALCAAQFLSTPSGWRATKSGVLLLCKAIFLSTPSGWRATFGFYTFAGGLIHFYPRPPGGGRLVALQQVIQNVDFYPRPPGGGRLEKITIRYEDGTISIHALRVEGDIPRGMIGDQNKLFLSTPSGWRATQKARITIPTEAISIHALRVEGDIHAKPA